MARGTLISGTVQLISAKGTRSARLVAPELHFLTLTRPQFFDKAQMSGLFSLSTDFG